MDSLQVVLVVIAATFAAAVTFVKANANPLDRTHVYAAESHIVGSSLPAGAGYGIPAVSRDGSGPA